MGSLILFGLVLVVVGGLIAWLGDRLGTRIGKKRWSVLGLRPRHTATLLTILAGIVIALATLVTLMTYDRSVQRALLHGPELIRANKRLKAQNLAQQKQITAGEAQLAAEQKKLLPVLIQLKEVRTSLGRSQQTLKLWQARLDTAQKQLATTQQTLAVTHADLSAAQQRVQAAKAALDAAHRHVQVAQKQVQQLSRRGQILTTQNASLEGTRRLLMKLAERANASGHTLIYPSGQDIGRTVVKTAQPVVSVERQLTAFLDDLGAQAFRHGGRLGNNRRAVVIALPITDLNPDEKPSGKSGYTALDPTQEQHALRALAQNIAGAGRGVESVVVVAHVAYNTFNGEQTDIELKPYDNVLIYPKDAVVASDMIDGTKSEADVLNALQTFLTSEVRPAALHEGLIPQTDPQTGRPQVGAIDQNTSLALVRQILQIQGPVRITAYASEDIYSVGPLRLRFSTAPAGVS